MADPVVFAGTPEIYLGGYRVTRSHTQFGMEAAWAENPDSRIGDVVRAFYPGIQTARASGNGLFAAGAGEIDAIVGARIGLGAPWPLTCCPAGDVDGGVEYSIEVGQYGYRFGGRHGESLPFTLQHVLRDGNGLVRGRIMLPRADRSGDTEGTARQLGALTAAQKMVAVLHVFTTSDEITVTVESDDAEAFTDPTTRGTFTAVDGIGREVLEISGAITDDWWRVVVAADGITHTAFASLAIVPV